MDSLNSVNPLNPEAGYVPAPEDPRELAAALRAGNISNRIFPYLDWRYKERGRRFTKSDSGWLVWLTRHRWAHVIEQVVWLRDLLSNRGMPSTILETHLRVLFRTLTRSIPEGERRYRSLTDSAQQLQEQREEQISSSRSRQLAADFVGELGYGSSPLVEGAARLVIAAVADEKLGVTHAVESLESWITDASQWRESDDLRDRLTPTQRRVLDAESFPQRWRSAIERTIADARRRERRRAPDR